MKKIYYSFILSLFIVFIGYKIHTMDVTKGISDLAYNTATTLAYNEGMAKYQQESETFEDYNRTRDSKINISRVENFLSKQIREAGLDPNNFKYYAGSVWLIFPLEKAGTYGFIIPSDDP